MATEQSASPSKGKLWVGRVLTALPALALTMGGVMKLLHKPEVVTAFTGQFGYKESSLTPIGLTEILCVIIYLIPQTAVLGAVLLTGYLGGAIATHVRIGEGFVGPLILALVAWAGIFLRDERLAALLPIRKPR